MICIELLSILYLKGSVVFFEQDKLCFAMGNTKRGQIWWETNMSRKGFSF